MTKKLAFTVALLVGSFTLPVYAEQFNLAELQQLVAKENPRIKSMESESRMMGERIPSSSALDDPRLKFGINNVPADSWSFNKEDMTSKEIGITQMIPLGGKLGLKERIASKEYEKTLEKIRKERIELLSSLRMNVYELLYLKSSKKIAEDIKDYLNLVVESTSASNKAGMATLTSVIKANIESVMIEEELLNISRSEIEARKKINYLVGRDVEIKGDDLPEPAWAAVRIDEAREEAYKSNPELIMLAKDHEISREETTLKKKEYIPDMELGVSYMFREKTPDGMKRDNMISAMISFNIPVWFYKKNIPMISEMEKKQDMISKALNDKKNEINYKIESQFNQLKNSEKLYRLYNDKLIPQAALTLETALGSYKTNASEIMSVIDTVRMLLKYKKEAVAAKKEYLTGLSEIYALMGKEELQ